MPRTTGSFDLAFGALGARLRIAIREEVADLLAAERKREGFDRPMTQFRGAQCARPTTISRQGG